MAQLWFHFPSFCSSCLGLFWCHLFVEKYTTLVCLNVKSQSHQPICIHDLACYAILTPEAIIAVELSSFNVRIDTHKQTCYTCLSKIWDKYDLWRLCVGLSSIGWMMVKTCALIWPLIVPIILYGVRVWSQWDEHVLRSDNVLLYWWTHKQGTFHK